MSLPGDELSLGALMSLDDQRRLSEAQLHRVRTPRWRILSWGKHQLAIALHLSSTSYEVSLHDLLIWYNLIFGARGISGADNNSWKESG